MSLASLFAAGIALGSPQRTIVALSGDGAFCMNPGMLLVERQLALPNLKHFVLANGCYGSTSCRCRFRKPRTMPRWRAPPASSASTISRRSKASPRRSTKSSPARYVFSVLHVEPLGRRVHSPPLDGPEVKFRFGRYLELMAARDLRRAVEVRAIPSPKSGGISIRVSTPTHARPNCPGLTGQSSNHRTPGGARSHLHRQHRGYWALPGQAGR